MQSPAWEKKGRCGKPCWAFLANGHILLEDMPGVGKTTMARAFSRAMMLECRRVQFTPDVMPSDLTGFSIYRKEEERFVYQPGSVSCNLLLADEINRTSPKTQSALLEVMEERSVSVEGVTRRVPHTLFWSLRHKTHLAQQVPNACRRHRLTGS